MGLREFVPKKKELTGDWGKMCNEKLHDVYF
jgi:hypothetical protein